MRFGLNNNSKNAVSDFEKNVSQSILVAKSSDYEAYESLVNEINQPIVHQTVLCELGYQVASNPAFRSEIRSIVTNCKRRIIEIIESSAR